ncbi:MAG TPA: aminopeptidase P family N-terminal domain-containing protein, partial [Candidatus Udaeobacter sp.]|nr:aminopeptidase P family N-terminal domain-containing protein [Candidatus Udaeobacter sp.]
MNSRPLATAAAGALEELRRWMAGHHVDAAYVTHPVSIEYLTGFRASPMERLMALAVRSTGATLIVPALEKESAEGHSRNAEIVAWRDGEDGYALVARALSGSREIAVEKEHLSLHAA